MQGALSLTSQRCARSLVWVSDHADAQGLRSSLALRRNSGEGVARTKLLRLQRPQHLVGLLQEAGRIGTPGNAEGRERNFRTLAPNEFWLADVAEGRRPAGSTPTGCRGRFSDGLVGFSMDPETRHRQSSLCWSGPNGPDFGLAASPERPGTMGRWARWAKLSPGTDNPRMKSLYSLS